MIRPVATSVAGVTLVLGFLTACGGDDSGGGDSGGGDTADGTSGDTTGDTTGEGGSYCDQLAAAQTEFESLGNANADPTQIDEAFATLQSLGDDAPEQVAGAWDMVNDGFETVERGLADAGLTFQDLSDPQALLEVDPQTLQQLQQEFQSLSTQQFDNALTSISEHAEQECGVDLGGAGGSAGG